MPDAPAPGPALALTRVQRVSRVDGRPNALLVHFDAAPTDHDVREVQDILELTADMALDVSEEEQARLDQLLRDARARPMPEAHLATAIYAMAEARAEGVGKSVLIQAADFISARTGGLVDPPAEQVASLRYVPVTGETAS